MTRPSGNNDRIVSFFAILSLLAASVVSKEIVATNDWQKVGENDTIPAGLEIRMDLSKHETWVRMVQEDEKEDIEPQEKKKRCGPSCKDRQRARGNLRGRKRLTPKESSSSATWPLGKIGATLFGFFFLWFGIFHFLRHPRILSSNQRRQFGGVHEL